MQKKLKFKLKKFEQAHDRYVFTDNRHPEKGIMSTILGVISAGALGAAVLFTYNNGGRAEPQYAAAALVAAVFSVVGFILGIMSKRERDIFNLFPNLGITLNLLCILFVLLVLVLAFI